MVSAPGAELKARLSDMGLLSPIDPDAFVVHEWGTFTSMQGADGRSLLGLHHEEEALPAFVYSRSVHSDDPKGIELLPEPVNQKLETPVLYFYTPNAIDVRVDVSFPKGIVSQWYPGAAAFGPEVGGLSRVADGYMTWEAQVRPGPVNVEPVPTDDIWAPSREVPDAAGVWIGGEQEKFIFYRGLGRFDLPVSVHSVGTDLEITNSGDHDMTINMPAIEELPTTRFNVHLYAIFRVKVINVEAPSQAEAITKAEGMVNLHELVGLCRDDPDVEHVEWAEEIAYAMVDES